MPQLRRFAQPNTTRGARIVPLLIELSGTDDSSLAHCTDLVEYPRLSEAVLKGLAQHNHQLFKASYQKLILEKCKAPKQEEELIASIRHGLSCTPEASFKAIKD